LLKLNVSCISGKVLAVLIEGNRHPALLDRGLSAFEEWLMTNQGLIKAKFSQASRYTPVFLDNYVVEKFIDGICALLHEVAANPRHELRLRFDEAVRELIERLQTSEEYRDNGEAVMRDFVEHLRNEKYYRQLWAEIRFRVQADLAGGDSLTREHIAGALVALGKGILAEPALRQKLNAWWLNAVREDGAAPWAPDLGPDHAGRQELGCSRSLGKGGARVREGSAIHSHQWHAGRRRSGRRATHADLRGRVNVGLASPLTAR
jgi:uncharacterized membrane-anchored protein YjiN (DUF445 family)